MLIKVENSNSVEYHYHKHGLNIFVRDLHNGFAEWISWHDDEKVAKQPQVWHSEEAISLLLEIHTQNLVH